MNIMPQRHQKPQNAATAQSLSLLERNSSTGTSPSESHSEPLTQDEQHILDVYHRLNADGRMFLRTTLEMLTYNDSMVKPMYTKTGNVLTLK